MKSLVLLLCFAQLWGCQSAPQGAGLGFRELACDDPETEHVALIAVDYLNKHLLQGFRQILNQIDKVKVWSRVSEPTMHELNESMQGIYPVSRRLASPSEEKTAAETGVFLEAGKGKRELERPHQ